MSGRTKECGKSVAELTDAELQSELKRCREFLSRKSDGPAAKGVRKRLYEIEKRIRREGAKT